MADDDSKDPTIKKLIAQSVATGEPLGALVDAVTAQQLERWFGLPSFTQVEQGDVVVADTEDADLSELRVRRARAIDAIDPALLATIASRFPEQGLGKFELLIKQTVDLSLAMIDLAMIENKMSIAEPREYERPEDIEDQLKDASPQAMLRDLHRPETEFYKQFEIVDVAADQRLDGIAEVATAMSTNWKLPPMTMSHSIEFAKQLDEAKTERSKPWRDIPSRVALPNRKVTE